MVSDLSFYHQRDTEFMENLNYFFAICEVPLKSSGMNTKAESKKPQALRAGYKIVSDRKQLLPFRRAKVCPPHERQGRLPPGEKSLCESVWVCGSTKKLSVTSAPPW